MDIDFKYAYLILDIPFFVIWVLFFLLSKETRKEQLIMSVLFIPAGPLSELLYFSDYWAPASVFSFSIGPVIVYIEDLIFAFALGGVGSVIYEAIFSKILSVPKGSVHYVIAIPLIILVGGLVTVSLFLLGVNSIFATSLGFIVAALLIVSQRKDLFIDSLLSGVLITVIMFIAYGVLIVFIPNTNELIRQGWLLYGTQFDIRILGIPLTEMMWYFTWGMVAGPLYEFARKMKFERT